MKKTIIENGKKKSHLFNSKEKEVKINIALKQYNLNFSNPITLFKEKNNEMEQYFTRYNKNYYMESYVGNVIIEYLNALTIDAIKSLNKLLIFEKEITLSNGLRLPLSNPYIDSFGDIIEEMTRTKIDETFCKKIDRFTKEKLKEEKFTKLSPELITKAKQTMFLEYSEEIKNELIELGYPEIATTIIENTINEIDRKTRPFTLKRIKS